MIREELIHIASVIHKHENRLKQLDKLIRKKDCRDSNKRIKWYNEQRFVTNERALLLKKFWNDGST